MQHLHSWSQTIIAVILNGQTLFNRIIYKVQNWVLVISLKLRFVRLLLLINGKQDVHFLFQHKIVNGLLRPMNYKKIKWNHFQFSTCTFLSSTPNHRRWFKQDSQNWTLSFDLCCYSDWKKFWLTVYMKCIPMLEELVDPEFFTPFHQKLIKNS